MSAPLCIRCCTLKIINVSFYAGLISANVETTEYTEFESAEYQCQQSTYLMYDPNTGDALSQDASANFKVECGLDGKFPDAEEDVDWPVCDSPTPKQCGETDADFLEAPEGVAISIVEKKAVNPGGSVYYRCDGYPDMTTDMGDDIKVR